MDREDVGRVGKKDGDHVDSVMLGVKPLLKRAARIIAKKSTPRKLCLVLNSVKFSKIGKNCMELLFFMCCLFNWAQSYVKEEIQMVTRL